MVLPVFGLAEQDIGYLVWEIDVRRSGDVIVRSSDRQTRRGVTFVDTISSLAAGPQHQTDDGTETPAARRLLDLRILN